MYSIPKKLIGEYDSDLNAMIDNWSSLLATLEEFKSTIYDQGIDFVVKNKATVWIVDTSQGKGAFKKEVQDFIQSHVAPKCAEAGIKYFFMILPQSAIAKLAAKRVVELSSNNEGMQTFQVGSMEEVMQMLETVQ